MHLLENLRKHSLAISIVIVYTWWPTWFLPVRKFMYLTCYRLFYLIVYLALARIDLIYFIIVASHRFPFSCSIFSLLHPLILPYLLNRTFWCDGCCYYTEHLQSGCSGSHAF